MQEPVRIFGVESGAVEPRFDIRVTNEVGPSRLSSASMDSKTYETGIALQGNGEPAFVIGDKGKVFTVTYNDRLPDRDGQPGTNGTTAREGTTSGIQGSGVVRDAPAGGDLYYTHPVPAGSSNLSEVQLLHPLPPLTKRHPHLITWYFSSRSRGVKLNGVLKCAAG